MQTGRRFPELTAQARQFLRLLFGNAVRFGPAQRLFQSGKLILYDPLLFFVTGFILVQGLFRLKAKALRRAK